MTLELLAGNQQSGESKKAIIACNDYLRMGVGRSLRGLLQKYSEGEAEKAPTKTEQTLFKWSSRYGWVKRAEEYDAKIEQEKTAFRKKIMEEGLALDYNRVIELLELFTLLKAELLEKDPETGVLHNLWLPDVKSIDKKPIWIERYNSALISDIRGVLDDIAKETGGRKQRIEQENSGETTITINVKVDDD